MSQTSLIKNAKIVNEGQVLEADVRIRDDRLDTISGELSAEENETIISN